MSSFNDKERAILKTTYCSYRPMSIREIAGESQISWVTARKYINILIERNWLLLIQGKRSRFKFNYDKLREVGFFTTDRALGSQLGL